MSNDDARKTQDIPNPINGTVLSQTDNTSLLTLDDVNQDHDFLHDMDCRTRLAYESQSLCWGIIVLLLVITDLIIFFVELADEGNNIAGVLITTRVSLVLAILLCFEWLIRLYAVGPVKFLCSGRILPWVDFVASFVGLILVSYSLNVLLETHVRQRTSRYFAAITVARLVRVFRVCFIVRSQKVKVVNATRRLVSQNRRRFKDAEFDLDLTYVTDGIIAMSLPAHKSKDRLYRNNIDDVERFFRQRHTGHYRIYNVTSERRYGVERFEGEVATVDIDDHNPTPLLELRGVCDSIQNYLNEDTINVAAIHCKGGKGRTGTAICCYLLHSRALADADASRAYFASRRTDHSRGDTYQGVQTPSQARYIAYYARMLHNSEIARDVEKPPGYILLSATMRNLDKGAVAKGASGATFELIVYDGAKAVRLKKMSKTAKKISANAGDGDAVGESKGNEMTEDRKQGNKFVPCKPIATVKGTKENLEGVKRFEHAFDFGPDGVFVRGDVKCRMLSSFSLPGKKYDSSFMYFWFHTAFFKSTAEEDEVQMMRHLLTPLSDGSSSVVVHLKRNHLDNGHHRKNQKVLIEDFCIDLKFRRATAEECKKAGPYTPKLFEDVTVGTNTKSTTATVNIVVEKEDDDLLSVSSPWSKK